MAIPCPACGAPLWIRASRIDCDAQPVYRYGGKMVSRTQGTMRVEAEFHCQGAGCEVTIKTALPSFIDEIQALHDDLIDPGRPQKALVKPEPLVGPLPEWPKADEIP